MGYDERDGVVRADVFEASGKWIASLALDMRRDHDVPNVYDAVARAVHRAEVRRRFGDEVTVVVLEPHHGNPRPVMLSACRCRRGGYDHDYIPGADRG
jgi:hypothetical protein